MLTVTMNEKLESEIECRHMKSGHKLVMQRSFFALEYDKYTPRLTDALSEVQNRSCPDFRTPLFIPNIIYSTSDPYHHKYCLAKNILTLFNLRPRFNIKNLKFSE